MRQLLPFALTNQKIICVFDLPIPKTGKGIFTTIKVVNRIPLFLEHHVERLTLHARVQGITFDDAIIEKNIQRLLLENTVSDAAIRISVLSQDTILFHATTLPNSENVKAITHNEQHPLPTIKKIDRSIYDDAQQSAGKKGAVSALFVDNECFIESIMSNIVSLDRDGNVITPPLKEQGLQGITRQILLEKHVLQEKEIPVSTMMPLVLINSLRVQGVTSLDGIFLPDFSKLLHIVRTNLQQEEKAYEDSYSR